ncbi:haloalkane dehalogenase [Tepidibacter hydrothermalis]|uniref:Haloalkane dehalogenase n=1 Tax=Tepidibacter hydrothermalis TaxID=3036126 RepID=A0ABY8EKS1_9FIRM|nr:haloalkane dehalogenase [Tepidibacter hydrothermalis]WFD11880.1 haloalkane dehalogenase [Tepidibacter hydrothermalis]
MTQKILKTPSHRFSNLKDYPFKSNYIDVGGVNMHYVDEGDKNNKVIFLFHGQPSWSYLYRHMIPQLVNEGYRVIAPDLIGFGKSDKPTHSSDHSYSAHVKWMSTFIEKLGIKHAAAFMQDWGGMIGLRVLANNPEWLDRLVVANTALAESKGFERWMLPKMLKIIRSTSLNPTIQSLEKKMNYANWAAYFSRSKKLEIGKIMQLLTTKSLSKDEMEAYDAPFPTPDYYAGPRKMPEIVVSDLDKAYEDWQKLKQWKNPVLTLFSDKDPFLADQGYDKLFQQNFPGAKGQPHITMTNASHFLQEDQSSELVSRILNWLKHTKF